jgi:O-antigen/teichoic acid export membrane protein
MFSKLFKISDLDLNELLAGAFAALSIRILAVFATFGLTLVVARSLGSELSGVFFLGLTLLAICSKLARLGTDNALTKFIAASQETKEIHRVIESREKTQYLVASVSILMACLLGIFSRQLAIYIFHDPRLTEVLLSLSIAVPIVALTWVNSQALKGLKLIRAAVASTALITPFLTVALSCVYGLNYGLTGVIWSYLCATVLAYLFSGYSWRKSKPKVYGYGDPFLLEELLSASFPLLGVVLLNLIMVWSGTLILGVFGSSSDVAVYTVANRTALLISFCLFAVNAISAPKFSQLYARNDLKAMRKVYIFSSQLLIFTSAPLMLIIVVFPSEIMGIFGSDFKAGVQALVLLSLGQFFNTASGSVATILMMSNFEKIVRNNAMVATAVNLTLNIALIPSLGVTGAAVATSASLVVQNSLNAYAVWSKFRFSPIQIFIGRKLKLP